MRSLYFGRLLPFAFGFAVFFQPSFARGQSSIRDIQSSECHDPVPGLYVSHVGCFATFFSKYFQQHHDDVICDVNELKIFYSISFSFFFLSSPSFSFSFFAPTLNVRLLYPVPGATSTAPSYHHIRPGTFAGEGRGEKSSPYNRGNRLVIVLLRAAALFIIII